MTDTMRSLPRGRTRIHQKIPQRGLLNPSTLLFLSLLSSLPHPSTSQSLTGYDGSFCPNMCGMRSTPMHGWCDASTVLSICSCFDAYSGPAPDCSERACPLGRAWFDMPVSPDTAHTTFTTCSSKGRCDYSLGVCKCDAGFEGEACERSSCPGSTTTEVGGGSPCSGHGQCLHMRDAGLREPYYQASSYLGWESERIYGCVCDDGWSGASCNVQPCPVGSDPLYRGGHEVQVATALLEIPEGSSLQAREVQKIRVDVPGPIRSVAGPNPGTGGPADTDEEQVFRLTAVGAPPVGYFTLSVDCSPQVGGCILWEAERKRRHVTGRISLDSSSNDPSIAAENVRIALESLPHIGEGQVTVEGTYVETGDNFFEYAFHVAFIGDRVPGNIPLMQFEASGVDAPGGAMVSATIKEVVNGSEIRGVVEVTWDDAANYPSFSTYHSARCTDTTEDVYLNPLGVRSARWRLGDNLTYIHDVLVSMVFGCLPGYENGNGNGNGSTCQEPPPRDALVVTREYSGGPWEEYTVTFAKGVRTRGNLALLTQGPNTSLTFTHEGVTLLVDPAGGPQLLIEEVTPGVFIEGEWTARLPYYLPDGTNTYTQLEAGPFLWCEDASAVATALSAFDEEFASGRVGVSRERSPPNPGQDWLGSYLWRITFETLSGDVPPLILADTLGSNVAADATLTLTEAVKGDNITAAVNEVQLIDCKCSAPVCNDPVAQGFHLTFKEGTTSFLPYSISPSDLRAALRALPGVPDVLVRYYDLFGGTKTTLCDPDGTTAAITFAWNPGPQPPLTLLPSNDFLPSLASLSLLRAPSFGGFGGGQARLGTRKLVPCSNRGTCSTSASDGGVCTCFDGFGVGGDNGGWPDASPANASLTPGDVEEDIFLHCGLPLLTISECPESCNAPHGTCSGSPEFLCTCKSGWSGPSCAQKGNECPSGPAWFSVPTREMHSTGPVIAHTASVCSGHGKCSSGECACEGGWGGKDCSMTPCPGGGGAGGTATVPSAPASNASAANASSSSSSSSSATATLATLATCGNGAPCATLRQYAQFFARTSDTSDPILPESGLNYSSTSWDADVIRGCACEGASEMYVSPDADAYRPLTGHDCAWHACPYGPDPQDIAAMDAIERGLSREVQDIDCTYGAGRVRLGFRGLFTRWIRWDAYVFDADAPLGWVDDGHWTVESALRGLNTTIPFVLSFRRWSGAVVSSESDDGDQIPWRRICDPFGSVTVSVTFQGMPGDAPLLVAEANEDAENDAGGGAITVVEVVKGKLDGYECNRRGTCNRATGRCVCQPQFGSSDGAGSPGEVGDCGYRNPLWKW